jgi:fluoride exporter
VSVLLVFLGGALGAPTRYLIDRHIQQRYETVFPLGTLTVNILGSLILGVLLGLGTTAGPPPEAALLLLGPGFCGALTTFSTFGFETVRLLEDGSILEAAVNAIGSLLVGVLAAAIGFAAGAAI